MYDPSTLFFCVAMAEKPRRGQFLVLLSVTGIFSFVSLAPPAARSLWRRFCIAHFGHQDPLGLLRLAVKGLQAPVWEVLVVWPWSPIHRTPHVRGSLALLRLRGRDGQASPRAIPYCYSWARLENIACA